MRVDRLRGAPFDAGCAGAVIDGMVEAVVTPFTAISGCCATKEIS